MGLFKKKTQPEPQEAPLIVTDADLPQARELVGAFLDAVGNDPALHYAGLQIALASGAPDMQEVVMGRAPASAIDRPWRWLAAVAEQAASANDPLLAGRVAWFAAFWTTTLGPRMGIGNMLEMRMDPPKGDVLPRIYTAAAQVLPQLPDDAIIIDHPTGTVRVGTVLAHLARALPK